MPIRLLDGRGNGHQAAVDADLRVLTSSVSYPMMIDQSYKGLAFGCITDEISLTTTGSYSGILYIKNASPDYHLHIGSSTLSTNGVGVTWKMIKNPTAGTLISAGTAITPVNLYFSSGRSFIGTAMKGADAKTVTDGTTIGVVYSAFSLELSGQESLILDEDDSLAIVCKPSAAATIAVTLGAFFHDRNY